MINSSFNNKIITTYFTLILAAIGFILGSPKWTILIGPWIGLVFLLFFIRKVTWKKAILLGLPAIYLFNFIVLIEVFPAPLPILVVILFIVTVKGILPYLIDKLSKAKERGFIGTLIFPSALVTLEYLNTFNSGNVWTSVANTQYGFLPFQQIASIFGMWGITFLMAWMASLLNWMYHLKWNWMLIRKGVLIASSIYLGILSFGTIRFIQDPLEGKEAVKVAGITQDNTPIMETLYKDNFGEIINIPLDISQTDARLQEANKAMAFFIEDPYQPKFKNTHSALKNNIDNLFNSTVQSVSKGAKIIIWSEAIGLVLDSDESSILTRARKIAKENEIYLFISLGVIHPGPITQDRLFLVNKTVSITPEGKIANIYLKSNPVPMAEQEYGSDDIIPVLETQFGKISPVICYDADIPRFMSQIGALDTDILLVPSGDWKAIDPYHPYMARLRAIEYGVSLIRPVSRATSIITAPNGKILNSQDFFESESSGITIADVPIKGEVTFYEKFGDLLAYLCTMTVLYILIEFIFNWIRMRSRKKSLRMKSY